MRIEEGYTALDGYTQYALYSDENIYEIAEDRSIPDITQITMKGDTNRQYITFQMPRYFDGVDLTTKQIIVRWYNDKNVEVGGSYSDICDVRYSEEFIRFAWLLDFGVTEVPGGVGFSFESIGTNEVENSYVWKTGIGKLPITDNMDNGAGGDEPSEDWFTKLMAKINELYKAAEAAELATEATKAATEKAETATAAATEATGKANTATAAAKEATGKANTATAAATEATGKANTAADAANKAASSVYTDRDFLLLRNDDGTLTLTFDKQA